MALISLFFVYMTAANNERIARMEEQITDLKKDLGEVKSDVKQIKEIILNSDLTRRVTNIERQNGLWKWLSPSLAAVLGSLMTFLVIEYLKNAK